MIIAWTKIRINRLSRSSKSHSMARSSDLSIQGPLQVLWPQRRRRLSSSEQLRARRWLQIVAMALSIFRIRRRFQPPHSAVTLASRSLKWHRCPSSTRCKGRAPTASSRRMKRKMAATGATRLSRLWAFRRSTSPPVPHWTQRLMMLT